MMITNKKIIEKVKKATNIAIFAHSDPDPDALGSMFGFGAFCQNMGKKCSIFAVKKCDNYLNYIFPMEKTRQDFVASDFDLVVLLDVHSIERIEVLFQEEVSKAKNLMIIDHHQVTESEKFEIEDAKIMPEMAAASEIVISLFRDKKIKPSKECATYLYAGLMGDTDRFLHSNLSQTVFEDAIFLMQCGADVQHVYDFMYRYITKEDIKVNQYLYNNITYLDGGKTAYVIFSISDMQKLGVGIDAVKEFSNTLIRIKGVELSFLIYEKAPKEYKISMRSASVNLVPFSNKMGGGGHPNATGFSVFYGKTKIKQEIPKWSLEILNG